MSKCRPLSFDPFCFLLTTSVLVTKSVVHQIDRVAVATGTSSAAAGHKVDLFYSRFRATIAAVLFGQSLKQSTEFRHFCFLNFQPASRVPDFHTDDGTHNHDFLTGFDSQKAAKAVRDQQS